MKGMKSSFMKSVLIWIRTAEKLTGHDKQDIHRDS